MQTDVCSEPDPGDNAFLFLCPLDLETAEHFLYRVDRDALISSFLLCSLGMLPRRKQGWGRGVGETAVNLGPVSRKETRLEPACGKRVSKTFKHPASTKPKVYISQLN